MGYGMLRLCHSNKEEEQQQADYSARTIWLFTCGHNSTSDRQENPFGSLAFFIVMTTLIYGRVWAARDCRIYSAAPRKLQGVLRFGSSCRPPPGTFSNTTAAVVVTADDDCYEFVFVSE
ncbi:hypothetical protein ABEB36_006781 [Hypothenemus hampei]|uniref:Uncharacterized protein n=1 Tax=Hypothenemus hampei TaxID=57062 RepID=A0ABD1ERR3_HYPHA